MDPPPVVELRIFEGPTIHNSKDITFTYNANFFLYATLDHARVMAHGRVQTPAANAPPVLTGMPVSGMAYLDRPQEAGYFLFPDLSVRHEGRYRFAFNLYEEVKEDKDMDLEPGEPVSCGPLDHATPGSSFDWRMDIKSKDFVVYSAKKFPGLAESTGLSRCIAEQGCRVRIRRDVRMRRRDSKGRRRREGGEGGGDGYDNDEESLRPRRTETPDVERINRARSASNHSVERTPYSVEPQRRPSGVSMDYPAPPGFGGAQSYSGGGHLSFGGQAAGPQYPPQPMSHHSQSGSLPPSPSSYQGAPSYPKPSPYAAPPSGYDRPPSRQYAMPDPSPRRESYAEHRPPSSSMSGYPPPPPPDVDHAKYAMRHEMPLQASQPPPPMETKPDMSSLNHLPSFRHLEDSLSSRPSVLGPSAEYGPHRTAAAPAPAPVAGSKRKTEDAFGEPAPERVQSGRRPANIYEEPIPTFALYKRADGFESRRDFYPIM